MPETTSYIYEPLVGRLENGQQVLVQLFRDPDTLELLQAQIAFRCAAWDTWGVPFTLEVAP
jgi:hypothetical protein